MQHPTTLQINTAPVDYRFLPQILKHQLKIFGNSCEEILLTIETQQSKKTRWRSNQWDENLQKIYELVEELQLIYPHLKPNPVDYSYQTRKKVSRYFLSSPNKLVPFKDFRGGPYYSYYYGIYSSSKKYVLHMDSDILYHGDGDSWLSEALSIIKTDRSALLVAPLIGPPVLEGKNMPIVHKKRYNPISNYDKVKNGYVYKDMSTRVFLVAKARLKNFCPITYPNFDQIMKSWIRKTSPYDTPEKSISDAMQKEGIYRIDFLGEGKGLWSIHSDFSHDQDFLKKLDHIINKIEEGFFTESQRGWHDFSHDFYDALTESFYKEKVNT